MNSYLGCSPSLVSSSTSQQENTHLASTGPRANAATVSSFAIMILIYDFAIATEHEENGLRFMQCGMTVYMHEEFTPFGP